MIDPDTERDLISARDYFDRRIADLAADLSHRPARTLMDGPMLVNIKSNVRRDTWGNARSVTVDVPEDVAGRNRDDIVDFVRRTDRRTFERIRREIPEVIPE
jgi:hypothetical protein